MKELDKGFFFLGCERMQKLEYMDERVGQRIFLLRVRENAKSLSTCMKELDKGFFFLGCERIQKLEYMDERVGQRIFLL
jgi:hypothetical protein